VLFGFGPPCSGRPTQDIADAAATAMEDTGMSWFLVRELARQHAAQLPTVEHL
jgi:hypothetical protein